FMLPAPPPTYTLSLHDALPISVDRQPAALVKAAEVASVQPSVPPAGRRGDRRPAHEDLGVAGDPHARAEQRWTNAQALRRGTRRSEEHTSELQSRFDLVCRLLL